MTNLAVNFVQWALNILKKPIVTVDWLYQCWNEHRIVPQESFRVLPFSGLTICVTRIPAGIQAKLSVGASGCYFLSCAANFACFCQISGRRWKRLLHKMAENILPNLPRIAHT